MNKTAALILSVLVAGPVLAAEPTDPAVENEAASFPTLTDEERTAAFAPYLEAVVAGDANASHQLLTLLDDPSLADLHGEVWLNLARQLEGLGDAWSVASVHAFTQAIQHDGERAAPDMLRALTVARSSGDVEAIAAALSEQIAA